MLIERFQFRLHVWNIFFFKMKQIKYYTHSSISQKKLSDLAILSIKYFYRNIDFQSLVNKFLERK